MTSRVLIIGGPRTGKTMLGAAKAAELGVPLRSTDSLASLGWSEASAEAAKWIDADGGWIVEGVTVVRALRKWLASNPGKPLAATVILLDTPHVPLTPGQQSMAKGVATVWHEIKSDVWARGATVSGRLSMPYAAPAKPLLAPDILAAQDGLAPVAVPLE